MKKTFSFIVLLLFSLSVFAGTEKSSEPNWAFLIGELFAGLALFMYGMDKMSAAMKKSAGNKMRNILSKLSNNRFIGLLVGGFVTMIIQSSSATTVMLVSFVQSGLMQFAQSIGIILGANIGSTFTAQIIAFKLTDFAIFMIASGFLFMVIAQKDKIKTIGEALFGFGLLFFGMKLMSDAMYPLRSYEDFISILRHLENPFAGIAVGLLFTALIQSSSAFTGIVIVMASEGLISLEAGIPMIIGANIGTCVTAFLASMRLSREAKRVAMAHSFVNIFGALLFVFWIPYFAEIIYKTGGDTARQVANAHSVFNISIALFFLPFTGITAKLVSKILPDKEEKKPKHLVTHYINKQMVNTPEPAIDLAIAEIARSVKILGRMLEAVIIPFIEEEVPKDKYHPKLSLKQGLDMREEEIDFLEKEITEFIIELSKQPLDNRRMSEIFGLLSITNDIESIGDIIHREMVPLIDEKAELETDFSDEGKEEIREFHTKMMKQISRLEKVFRKQDTVEAVKILVKGEKYVVLESDYKLKHYMRLQDLKSKSAITHKLHSDLFDNMKQIAVYLENIAKTVAETSTFERESAKN